MMPFSFLFLNSVQVWKNKVGGKIYDRNYDKCIFEHYLYKLYKRTNSSNRNCYLVIEHWFLLTSESQRITNRKDVLLSIYNLYEKLDLINSKITNTWKFNLTQHLTKIKMKWYHKNANISIKINQSANLFYVQPCANEEILSPSSNWHNISQKKEQPKTNVCHYKESNLISHFQQNLLQALREEYRNNYAAETETVVSSSPFYVQSLSKPKLSKIPRQIPSWLLVLLKTTIKWILSTPSKGQKGSLN